MAIFRRSRFVYRRRGARLVPSKGPTTYAYAGEIACTPGIEAFWSVTYVPPAQIGTGSTIIGEVVLETRPARAMQRAPRHRQRQVTFSVEIVRRRIYRAVGRISVRRARVEAGVRREYRFQGDTAGPALRLEAAIDYTDAAFEELLMLDALLELGICDCD